MASFADLESSEPEFAARVRAVLDAHVHKVLATLRRDGSPRVSGIETRLVDGELFLAGMTGSVKFADLRRDPRLSLHSGADDPERFSADAKISGVAVEVTDPAQLAAFAGDGAVPETVASFELFRIDLGQVVLTALNDAKDALVITSWRPGRPLTVTNRT